MITSINQRWHRGRDSYRRAGEAFNPRAFEVAKIDTDNVAKAFVLGHHYSGSYPAARVRIGLYESAELVGVAVFSVPAQPRCLDCVPGDASTCVELGRFVLLDRVPFNAESWLIARTFDLLRTEGYTGVVSFSDPTPRDSGDGRTVFGGHIGTIYQATNATYLGRSKAETRRLLPDGTVIHGRALTKIRHRKRGCRYAAAILESHGADPLRDDEDAVAWVARWTERLCRPLRHPGNHKYAWALNRRDRRHLPTGLPYPKANDSMITTREETIPCAA